MAHWAARRAEREALDPARPTRRGPVTFVKLGLHADPDSNQRVLAVLTYLRGAGR